RERSGARDGPHRIGEVDDARRDDRPGQLDAEEAHPHPRGSDRVRPSVQGLPGESAGGRDSHEVVRRRVAGGAPRRPGRHPGRRDAGPRDDQPRADRRRDRPPRLRDAPHEERAEDDRPHHRRLPARPAAAGARAAGGGPAGRRLPAPVSDEGQERPGRRARDHGCDRGHPQPHPGREDAPDALVDPDGHAGRHAEPGAGAPEPRDAGPNRPKPGRGVPPVVLVGLGRRARRTSGGGRAGGRQGMTILDAVLTEAVTTGASDVYFLEGVPPAIKVDGLVSPIAGADALDADTMRAILERLLPVRDRKVFTETGEANLSHLHPILGRFRVNCYRAMGVSGAVLRRVKTEVPTIEELELPALLGSLALERQGLVLVVGATGAGKSTTVAAMLRHRSMHSRSHVVTIEDPVEYVHVADQSIVSQREVGIDTDSDLVGLRTALRQAPDVIFVGELRDSETAAVALHSAETGHLVLSTLHATNATTAVERLLHFFQPEVRPSVLLQLSLTLRAVVAQRLLPRVEGQGRAAAVGG